MDIAMQILKSYDLDCQHDAFMQLINYGLLMKDKGQFDDALRILTEAEKTAALNMGIESSDYAQIQEAIGTVYLEQYDVKNGQAHLKEAARIYEVIYEGDDELIEAKYQQIMEYHAHAGIVIGQHLLSARRMKAIADH